MLFEFSDPTGDEPSETQTNTISCTASTKYLFYAILRFVYYVSVLKLCGDHQRRSVSIIHVN